MKKLALKIDVDTYRGTREGVPRLVSALQAKQANATFLWSLGPDHTGRAIKQVFKPGFAKKVSRTSVVEHYGIKTLMYGTLLPGPDIGKKCANLMREVKRAGFEVGIHTFDHRKWQDHVNTETDKWTHKEMTLAWKRFEEIFNMRPLVHGAAGWQMNNYAFEWEKQVGIAYASDCRGHGPFIPVLGDTPIFCPQIPTTLPTLDELLGLNGLNPDNVHEHILNLTRDQEPSYCPVYTLHAELEGMKLLPVFERLLQGWRRQGYQLIALKDVYATLSLPNLPHCELIQGTVPGRSGTMCVQGKKVHKLN